MSSQTSTSSSTSDPVRPSPAGPGRRLIAFARLVHPFPSLLDALVVGALAVVAGGPPATAVLLAGSMLALQFSIGALNDAVDAPRDALATTAKPIPSGLVSREAALASAAALAAIGVGLAGLVRVEAVLAALVVLAIGFTYDLVLKVTPVSWAAFAVGIPFLPVFAWVGVGAPMPASFALLLPAAAVAGAVLAIGNTLVDIEGDARAAVRSLPVAIGAGRAWVLHAGLIAIVLVIAVIGAAALGGGGVGLVLAVGGALGLVAGATVLRSSRTAVRERGWKLECASTAALGIGWLLAVTAGP